MSERPMAVGLDPVTGALISVPVSIEQEVLYAECEVGDDDVMGPSEQTITAVVRRPAGPFFGGWQMAGVGKWKGTGWAWTGLDTCTPWCVSEAALKTWCERHAAEIDAAIAAGEHASAPASGGEREGTVGRE